MLNCLAPFLILLFNCALAKGLMPLWIMNTMAPIHLGGNPVDVNKYRTIMIGHMLTKLCGAMMEAKLIGYMETLSPQAPE